MDVTAVRTFVTVVDAGQFQEAATDLSATPQAVSKRIAPLEKELGVQLFTRDARGARLTIDGQAFLLHARSSSKPPSGPSTPYGQGIGRCAST